MNHVFNQSSEVKTIEHNFNVIQCVKQQVIFNAEKHPSCTCWIIVRIQRVIYTESSVSWVFVIYLMTKDKACTLTINTLAGRYRVV